MTLVVIVAILTGVSAWIFHRIETWPERTATRVSKAFAELDGGVRRIFSQVIPFPVAKFEAAGV